MRYRPKAVLEESGGIRLKPRQTFSGYYKGSFSPDGSLLALLYRDHIDLVDISSGARSVRLEIEHTDFEGVTFSPDGRSFATKYVTAIGSTNQIEKLTLWDTATGIEVRTLASGRPGLAGVDNLSFSSDGRYIASHAAGVGRCGRWRAGLR